MTDEANRCGCGHFHVVSLGDDGADAGCEELATCGCWDWHEPLPVVV